MPTITIRTISDEDSRRLRQLAAQNHRSMEEEAGTILHQALREAPEKKQPDLATAIREILDEYGVDGIDLPEIPREPAPEPPSFK